MEAKNGYGIRVAKNLQVTNVNATVQIGLQSIIWEPGAQMKKAQYPG